MKEYEQYTYTYELDSTIQPRKRRNKKQINKKRVKAHGNWFYNTFCK